MHHVEENMAKKHGKKYLEAAKKVDESKLYAPADAIRLVKETSYTKFDGSVEVRADRPNVARSARDFGGVQARHGVHRQPLGVRAAAAQQTRARQLA